jgi:S-adenosylmethionine:tRNA ribosyltransferase-isomerase
LQFKTKNGASVEVFCISPYQPANYEQSLQSMSSCIWNCLVGNQKRWQQEELRCQFTHNDIDNELIINKIRTNYAESQIEFRWTAKNCTFAQVLDSCGSIPLPPYMRRSVELTDSESYQTIYARHQGSVAAPTAGLHFTDRVFNSLKMNNIHTQHITLHVGAGTFLPIKTLTANEHTMHAEWFVVQYSSLELLRKNLENIIAVGTTSVRTLESLYWIGVKLLKNNTLITSLSQWEGYSTENISASEALEALANYLKINGLKQLEFSTSLMLIPTYKYKVVNGLITNFHQPHSTLLLLVSAMIGNDWRRVYEYALCNEYRFLSYGDSSLILNFK